MGGREGCGMGWDGMGGGQLVGIELVYAERVKGGGGLVVGWKEEVGWDGGGGWMGWMGEEMGNGKWEMGNGKWEMGNGKWEMGEGGGLVEGGNKGDGEVVGWEEVKGGLENDEWRMVG